MAAVAPDQISANFQTLFTRLTALESTVATDSATLTADSTELNNMMPNVTNELQQCKTSLIATVDKFKPNLVQSWTWISATT